MASPTRTAKVAWDLSRPTTPRALGSQFDGLIVVETLGRDEVDIEVRLPGNEIIVGQFQTVVASAQRGNEIRLVDLIHSRRADGSWRQAVKQFLNQFGGEFLLSDVETDLEAVAEMAPSGRSSRPLRYRGESRPQVTSVLMVRPGLHGVDVNWEIALRYPTVND